MISFEHWVSENLARHKNIKRMSLTSRTKSMYKRTKITETTETTDLCLCNERGILLDNMTGKDIYTNLIIRTGSGVTVSKIAKYIENSESVDWSKVYSWANKVPIGAKTKEFQYKFVNDLLSNRYWLKKWKEADSATRCYCKAHDENIIHMVWICSHTKQFWKDFTDFCSRNIRDTTLTLNDVLCEVEDGTICNLIFTAKTFVYNRRIHEDQIIFNGGKCKRLV